MSPEEREEGLLYVWEYGLYENVYGADPGSGVTSCARVKSATLLWLCKGRVGYPTQRLDSRGKLWQM